MNTASFLVWSNWLNVYRVTCNSYSILDHVLASFPDRISQSGVIDVGISDHQLIYCTRITARIKSYYHNQIIFRSIKNYSPDVYEEALRKLSFPNYSVHLRGFSIWCFPHLWPVFNLDVHCMFCVKLICFHKTFYLK